jgi:uncharacterized membrane protein
MVEINIGARIQCIDGPAGRCETLIVDRETARVTHLVLHDDTLPDPPYLRLAPVELVVQADRDLIHLSCSRDQVAVIEPFIQTQYVETTVAGHMMLHEGEVLPTYAAATSISDSTYEEGEILGGARPLRPGIRVKASDGYVGHIDELLIDPQTAQITHFVLRGGYLWRRKQVTLPLAAVDHVAEDIVYLKLDRQAIGQLPAIPLGPHHAKRGEEAPKVELVAVAFVAADHAARALGFVKEIRERGALTVLDAAVLVCNADGKITVEDTRGIGARKGRLLGAITGGLIGLAGGPVGALVGAAAGAGAGGLAGKTIDKGLSKQFLDRLAQYLQPDTSMLVLLVEHADYQLSEVIAEDAGVFFRQTLTDGLVEDLLAESG